MLNSIEPIWEQFHKGLKSLNRNRVEDHAAADDNLQEIFLRIRTRMDTLTGSSRLKSWVLQIAPQRNHRHTLQRDLEEITETVPAGIHPVLVVTKMSSGRWFYSV